jgi:hypothetical protein
MNQRATRLDGLADSLPIGKDPAAIRRRIELIEQMLERMFVVPGINRPVGLDVLLGFIPVVGDIAAAGIGTWIVWEARNLGMSRYQLARMMGNVGVDTAIGLIPFVGDAADFFFRSNSRNLKRIKRHLDRHHPETVTIQR